VSLENYLLYMMAHAVYCNYTVTADVFADTEHSKNRDEACIARNAFASNKANRKLEEAPKQQEPPPGTTPMLSQ
jgi:hypothetical protein